MRIFLTGATGYIGGAVTEALRARGHDVTALVRPGSEAKRLCDLGVFIVSGEVSSLPSLGETLAQYEAFVHTAFSVTDTVAFDRAAVDAFTSQKGFFVFTSGVWVLGNTDERGADESSPIHALPLVAWRPAHEQIVLASGRNAVVRPGCVYGGKQSMFAGWFAAADQGKPLEIAGDGENHWAAVNLHDLADCYVRVIEQRAPGIFHAVDDTTATMNECARAVAPDARIEHMPDDLARQNFGPFADALLVDQHVSSVKTRDQLGWQPKRQFVSSVDEQWREWRASLQKRDQ